MRDKYLRLLDKYQRMVIKELEEEPRYFNELCRNLDGKASRRSVAKALVKLEDAKTVVSGLKFSMFDHTGFGLCRWVREFKLKGRRYSKKEGCC